LLSLLTIDGIPSLTMANHIKLAILTFALCSQYAFSFQPFHQYRGPFSSTELWMGRKKKEKKLSYAERLQLHRERKAREQGLPPPGSVPTSSDKPGESTQELASKLIQAQRKSVDMLTFVKDRVDALPYPEILEALEKQSYVVVDDFLANEDVVTQLQNEAESLFTGGHMERNLADLGSGEYTVAIKGGEAQYPLCSRTIELVVSITKNMPARLEGMGLSGKNCIAAIRAADRKSRLAALGLVKDGALPDRPFEILADGDNDTRRVTLLYYPNAIEWDGDGGITVEANSVQVSSKRDRLVFLRSDKCSHRKNYFVGDDGRELACCIELDLVV